MVSWSGVLASVDDVSNLYGNTRLFTWREYDTETSLYFHRARYYNPQTGRFTSRDPIWQNDQINLYTYVRNSPLNNIDRDGKRGKSLVNLFMKVGEHLWWHVRWRNAIKRNLEYINSFTDNSEYIKAIIYEEQSHLLPIIEWYNLFWDSLWLWQIRYNPPSSDIDFFWYKSVKADEVIDEHTNISLMNERINIIKAKLEENWKAITMKNIWSAWNWWKSCIVWECDNPKAEAYWRRTEWYYSDMWWIENEKTLLEDFSGFIQNIKSYINSF